LACLGGNYDGPCRQICRKALREGVHLRCRARIQNHLWTAQTNSKSAVLRGLQPITVINGCAIIGDIEAGFGAASLQYNTDRRGRCTGR